MPETSLRERLNRLNHPTKSADFAGAPVHGATPRPRRQPKSYELPRGFEEVETPFGAAAIRLDATPPPARDRYRRSISYVDTETTGLAGGAGTYVFTAPIATPI